MHISNAQLQKVLELHLHKVYATQPKSEAGMGSRADKLTLSRQAAEMQQIKQTLAQLPDTRENVVRDLKQKLRAGDYKISEEELAHKMFLIAQQGRTKSRGIT